jgi:hypothetical protein
MTAHTTGGPMSDTPDAFTAAEQAAFAGFGTMHHTGDADRLRHALTAYRNTLAAAGILREQTDYTAHAAVLAARYLAAESGFPRYDGDGWELLLASTVDVEVAHRKALEQTTAAEDERRRDIAHARRVLLTIAARDDLSVDLNPGTVHPQEGGDQG